MRRLSRHLFTFAAVGSLLLCVAVCVLWARSYRHADAVVSWAPLGERITLRSQPGRLELSEPPPRPPAAAGSPDARVLVAEIVGHPVKWHVHREDVSWWRRKRGRTIRVYFRTLDAAEVWSGSGKAAPMTVVAADLLRALESRDTFAQAHLALAVRHRTQDVLKIEDRPDGSCVITLDGMRAVLRPVRENMMNPGRGTIVYGASAEIDPGRRRALRDQWHRRLDVSRGSVHYRWVAAAAALVAALLLTLNFAPRARARARLRAGLCLACGYNLIASHERCPECGTMAGRGIARAPFSSN